MSDTLFGHLEPGKTGAAQRRGMSGLGGGDSDRCSQINAFVCDVIMVQMESVCLQSYTPWIQSPMPPFPKVKQ